MGAVDQVDADDAERLLLEGGGGVLEIDVDDHVRGRFAGLALKADAYPSAPVLGALVAPGGHGVGEGEEGGGLPPRGAEPLEELAELVLEHGLETLATDVSRGLAVDGVADGHVV